jgi:hypothetical protein
MQYRTLYDFAINSGPFYNQHCHMAREAVSTNLWILHVRANLLPAYKRENYEPYEGMSKAEIALVAKELAAYYVQHVGEVDGNTEWWEARKRQHQEDLWHALKLSYNRWLNDGGIAEFMLIRNKLMLYTSRELDADLMSSAMLHCGKLIDYLSKGKILP